MPKSYVKRNGGVPVYLVEKTQGDERFRSFLKGRKYAVISICEKCIVMYKIKRHSTIHTFADFP